jgi:hypothetical protein
MQWIDRYRKVRRGEIPAEKPTLAYVWDYHPGQEFQPDDVAVVIGEDSQGGDYGEQDVIGVYALKDGRFATISGSCDTTGWD